MESNASFLTDPLIAAFLAVFVTFLGQWIFDEIRQHQKIRSFLRGIYEELNEVYNQLNSFSVKNPWKEFDEEISHFYRNVFQVPPDYSIIYRSDANLIGRIENSDLRRKIVKTYGLLETLMEAYKTNTRLVTQFEQARYGGEGDSSSFYVQLRLVAPMLREKRDLFDESAKELLNMLEKELSKSNERFWEQQ